VSAGECLKRALYASRSLPSLTSRTAVLHVALPQHSAAGLACQNRQCEATDTSVPACTIALVHDDPLPGVVSRAYEFPPAKARPRVGFHADKSLACECLFSTIRKRSDLLELVCSCGSMGVAEGEAVDPECDQAGAFSLMSTGGARSQSGAIIFRLFGTYMQSQKEPEDWAVCSDAA
jgi:hypothetical protein